MPIRQLPEDLINRIAAGEVVERPASVVKELVENAIDAGARRVAITTAGGGQSLIRIEDDGVGMDEADLELSVERHATSKLADDGLDDIRTLGFRGEALASIGSVAELTIASRRAEDASGLKLTVTAWAEAAAWCRQAMNRGTIVEVREPVRQRAGAAEIPQIGAGRGGGGDRYRQAAGDGQPRGAVRARGRGPDRHRTGRRGRATGRCRARLARRDGRGFRRQCRMRWRRSGTAWW